MRSQVFGLKIPGLLACCTQLTSYYQRSANPAGAMLLVSGLARRRRHGLCRGATDDMDDEAKDKQSLISAVQGKLRLGMGRRVPASQPSDAACATRTSNITCVGQEADAEAQSVHLIFIRFQKQNNHTTTRPNQTQERATLHFSYRSSLTRTYTTGPARCGFPFFHVCPPKNNQPPTYRTTQNKAPPTAK